jgi:hypothetical protein
MTIEHGQGLQFGLTDLLLCGGDKRKQISDIARSDSLHGSQDDADDSFRMLEILTLTGRSMFSAKSILSGLGSVLALYVIVWLYRAFSEVSTTRTSGRDTLGPSFIRILASPGFWIAAILVFFAVALFFERRALAHS